MLNHTYLDEDNGLYITPIQRGRSDTTYLCRVEKINENGDLVILDTQLFTVSELRQWKEVR